MAAKSVGSKMGSVSLEWQSANAAEVHGLAAFYSLWKLFMSASGPKGDVAAFSGHVCFTPESGLPICDS